MQTSSTYSGLRFADWPPCSLVRPSNPFARWEDRARQRLLLARMLDEAPERLRDMGLSRGAVEAEIAKPFWRA